MISLYIYLLLQICELRRVLHVGIVETIGEIEDIRVDSNVLMWDGTESAGYIFDVLGHVCVSDATIGCSIALNGVCLTVTELDKDREMLRFGISPETLRRSNLKSLKPGSKVNLERALLANGRNSGHNVQGHVDCTGAILEKWYENDSLWIKVGVPPDYIKYIVPKGFIAVDGASLTVCEVSSSWFTFMLVPHTQQSVIIPSKKIGEHVNIEVDVMAKLIEKSLSAYADSLIIKSPIIADIISKCNNLQQEIADLKEKINLKH